MQGDGALEAGGTQGRALKAAHIVCSRMMQVPCMRKTLVLQGDGALEAGGTQGRALKAAHIVYSMMMWVPCMRKTRVF